MRLLNTVYVTDHRAKVSVRQRAIEIRKGRSLVARFPMEGTEAVVLASAASITTEALGRFTRHGVRVASLHRSGSVRFVASGPTSGNVLLRVRQYEQSKDAEAVRSIAASVVGGKLQNCRRLMQRWAQDEDGLTRRNIEHQIQVVEERLGALATARDGDHIRGLEGDGARRYFKGMGAHLNEKAAPMMFVSRSRRPPRDPVNALLSYLYGLVTISCTGALDAVGLDPQVGFLHGLRPGRPSLALDLLEEFRPVMADRLAVAALARRQVRVEHFAEAAGGAWYLTDEGRKLVLGLYEEHRNTEVIHPLLGRSMPRALLPNVQATLLARHLRGDLPAYAPYVMVG